MFRLNLKCRFFMVLSWIFPRNEPMAASKHRESTRFGEHGGRMGLSEVPAFPSSTFQPYAATGYGKLSQGPPHLHLHLESGLLRCEPFLLGSNMGVCQDRGTQNMMAFRLIPVKLPQNTTTTTPSGFQWQTGQEAGLFARGSPSPATDARVHHRTQFAPSSIRSSSHFSPKGNQGTL